MKKTFFILLLILFVIPALSDAQGLVPCGIGSPGDPGFVRCGLGHLFVLAYNIFDFIVVKISTPLAGGLIVVGGIMLLVSAGNPNSASLARRILWGAFLGWLLIWLAWLIINSVCLALGATC